MNKWKNSTNSIAFIVLLVWPIGFIINIKLNTISEKSGEIATGAATGVSLLLMLAAFLFALCLRFFVAPKPVDTEKGNQRNLQVYALSFIVAIMIVISSVYGGFQPIGLVICAFLILLGYGIKKQIRGSIFGLIFLSAGAIFAERYFEGSSTWVWMYSIMYWTSLRYGLMTKSLVRR